MAYAVTCPMTLRTCSDEVGQPQNEDVSGVAYVPGQICSRGLESFMIDRTV